MMRAAEHYEQGVPSGFSQFYVDLLGLDKTGSGRGRRYSTRQLRRFVSWLRITRITGAKFTGRTNSEQYRQAMRLMAAASEGWVVMSEGRARWSLVPPVSAFAHGAVVMPVPDWLPEHQPR